MKKTYRTREEWLLDAGKWLEKHVLKKPLPRWQVAVGFPRVGKAGRKGRDAIGQCWTPEMTRDGTHHLFICPTIGDGARALDVLIHEMGHAECGLAAGHGPVFKAYMKRVGLEGKATATVASESLKKILEDLVQRLGPYPHSVMQKPEDGRGKKTDSPKHKRYVSRGNPEYKVNARVELVEKYGLPRDPWGREMVAL